MTRLEIDFDEIPEMKITGTWMAASNYDPKTWARSYAATAYLRPNIGRPNLNVRK